MNYVDLILLVLVGLGLWGGYARGFILTSVDLLLLLGSLAAAIHFYPYAENIFNRYVTLNSMWSRPLGFISVFILSRLLLSILVNVFLKVVSPSVHFSSANKILGVIPGVVNGLIYAAIFSALFLAIPISPTLSENTRKSRYASKLALQVEWLEEKLSPVFNDAVNQSFNKITIEPGSKETVDLKFTVADPRVRPELEAQMLTLINAERMKLKLRALVHDEAMVPVARAHSIDMFGRGYFSHQTPEGLTPADRVKNAKVRYLIMGENLALGQTLSICHRGLMNSPGHRANILSPKYNRVGIGIVDGGVHGLMITQEFRN